MATIAVSRAVPAPADVVWDVLTDWPLHGRWVPLTTVTVDAAADGAADGDRGGVGTRILGRTRLGPWVVDDPMVVVDWQPPRDGRPGRCLLVKRGSAVLGWARIEVRPTGRRRCRVTWTEDVEIAPAEWTGWASPLVAAAGRAMFGALVLLAGREARRRVAAGG